MYGLYLETHLGKGLLPCLRDLVKGKVYHACGELVETEILKLMDLNFDQLPHSKYFHSKYFIFKMEKLSYL